MGARIRSALIFVFASVASAATDDQSVDLQSGTPDSDQISQSIQGKTQTPTLERPRPIEASKAPNVPIPSDSPALAALNRLERATKYRMRKALTWNDPQLMHSMQLAGLGRSETVVAGSDLRMLSLNFNLQAPGLEAGKTDTWEMRAVIKGRRMARRFTSPAITRYLELESTKLYLEMGQLELIAAPYLIAFGAASPWARFDDKYFNAAFFDRSASAFDRQTQGEQFFQWRCTDVPGRGPNGRTPASVQFTDLVDLGARAVNETSAHVYRFYVKGPGPAKYPVELAVAQRSGLPVRIEITDPGGTEVMDFYDFGLPVTIDIPPCLGN